MVTNVAIADGSKGVHRLKEKCTPEMRLRMRSPCISGLGHKPLRKKTRDVALMSQIHTLEFTRKNPPMDI